MICHILNIYNFYIHKIIVRLGVLLDQKVVPEQEFWYNQPSSVKIVVCIAFTTHNYNANIVKYFDSESSQNLTVIRNLL